MGKVMLAYKLFKASRRGPLLSCSLQPLRAESATLPVAYQRCYSTKVDSDGEIRDYHLENSASTPIDDEYFRVDRMPDEEHEAILGLAEFEKSVQLFHDKKYGESEHYL